MDIKYIDADHELKSRLESEWSETVARHVHVDDGFTIVAMKFDRPVGVMAINWRKLPPPLPESIEAFIDIIEVVPSHRRRGISRKMLQMAELRAGEEGAYQLRAWSSEDKIEAIPMWKSLGFGLSPAVIYTGGQEVHGYYVTKVIDKKNDHR